MFFSCSLNLERSTGMAKQRQNNMCCRCSIGSEENTKKWVKCELHLIPFPQGTIARWICAIMEEHVWQGLETSHSSVSVETASEETPATWQRQVQQRGNLLEEKLGYVAHVNEYLSFFLFSGPCSPNLCKNDGLCEVITPTRRGDVFNEYICKCQPGFEGVHCQTSRLLLDVINESELLVLACAPYTTTHLHLP